MRGGFCPWRYKKNEQQQQAPLFGVSFGMLKGVTGHEKVKVVRMLVGSSAPYRMHEGQHYRQHFWPYHRVSHMFVSKTNENVPMIGSFK